MEENIISNGIKKCIICGEIQNISNFTGEKRNKDGHSSYCKICYSVKRKPTSKKYREKNKEIDRIKWKKYYDVNKKILYENKKIYNADNKDVLSEKRKKYKKENKEKIAISSKIYREKNKEKIVISGKIYRERNKDKIAAREKERAKNDINTRIRKNLRARLRMAINGNFKNGSAVRDLGCSIDFLKRHLSVKFYSNSTTGEQMSWENYGRDGWHIDHIIPLSSFNLTDNEQLIKACSYTNLQPLWAKDNLSKGNKILAGAL